MEKQSAKTRFWVQGSDYLLGRYLMRGSTPLGPELGLLITTQKVLFCAFNSLCFKHFCVVVLHLYSNWHVKDLAMTSNHICGYF